MRGTIELALVPAFVEVVRQGSFTAAARALELPKSTVSRRVSRLEDELGVPLLVRTTRKLRLTEAGEAFFARVAPAVEQVEEAARLVAEQQDEPRGVLRITVPGDVELMGTLLVRFIERYPEVRVEVLATGRKVDLVGERVDVAIRAGQLEDSGLVARRLARVEFRLFASERYLERAGEPRSVDELAEHECVLFRPTDGVAYWTLFCPEGERRVEVRGRFGADDLLYVRQAVYAGAGIGLLPSNILSNAPPHVRRVLPEVSMPLGAVHLVYPSATHLPAKVRAFRDFIVEHVAELAPTLGE